MFPTVVLASVVDPTTWREVVAMIVPAMSLPWAVVEARDADEVLVRVPIVACPMDARDVVALVMVAFVAVRLRTERIFVQRVLRTLRFVMVEVEIVVVPRVVVAAVSEVVAVIEPAVSVGTVRAWILRFEIVVVASVVVPMTARFPVVVRFPIVVEAKVDEPVARRFCVFVFVALVVLALIVAMFAVVPQSVVMVAETAERRFDQRDWMFA
jgi:hypothetical protein